VDPRHLILDTQSTSDCPRPLQETSKLAGLSYWLCERRYCHQLTPVHRLPCVSASLPSWPQESAGQLRQRKHLWPQGLGAWLRFRRGSQKGVSFSGDIQALSGRGAVQPALGDPASAGGWAGWPTEGPANPHHAGILWKV